MKKKKITVLFVRLLTLPTVFPISSGSDADRTSAVPANYPLYCFHALGSVCIAKKSELSRGFF